VGHVAVPRMIEGLSDLWQEYPIFKKQKILGPYSRKSIGTYEIIMGGEKMAR